MRPTEKEIGAQNIALVADESVTINFDWDTTGASIGDHTLNATASVVEVRRILQTTQKQLLLLWLRERLWLLM